MNNKHDCANCSHCSHCNNCSEEKEELIKDNLELRNLLEEITEKFLNKCNKDDKTIINENKIAMNELALKECKSKLLSLEEDLKNYYKDNDNNFDNNSSERQIRLLQNKVSSLSKDLGSIKGDQHFLD